MLYDAHNHLHDARLAPSRAEIFRALAGAQVAGAMVNGTEEGDWAAVAELVAAHPGLKASFGLHPWRVPGRSPEWLERLRAQLEAHPGAGVGEIGLDRWIEGHDLADQSAVLRAQLGLAAEGNRAATLHCIQAWGALWEIVRTEAVPARGFLLHAYGGPAEMVAGFVERGAYFSFSPYFLHARKGAQRAVFAELPAERLLVETDAPDLRPPDERNLHPLLDVEGKAINHPANLTVAYAGLAELRGLEMAALAKIVAENYARLFG